MSSDNYYLIRRYPGGGFAAVMGFASDDSEPEVRPEFDQPFPTIDAAVVYAESEYSEYGVSVHPECSGTGIRFVMVVNVDPAILGGDESIENAVHKINAILSEEWHVPGTEPIIVQPLSEVIAS